MPRSLSSSFFHLPRELRDQIYTELFAFRQVDQTGRELPDPLLLDVGTHIPHSPLGLPTSNAIPFSMLAPMCKASKQLYWEATPPYLSSCILSLDQISTTKFLMDWLSTFKDAGFKEIRHLEFTDFSQIDEDEGSIDHCLISMCPNLRTLNLKFRNTNRLDFPRNHFRLRHGNTHRRLTQFDALVENGRHKASLVIDAWNMLFLFDIRSLTKLTVSFPDESSVFVRQGLALASKEWIKRVWEERGSSIEVDCGFDDPGGW